MAFSSNFFLFGFFPLVVTAYFLSPPAFRNHLLLAGSLLFYVFDAGWMVWILIGSILFNHAVARTLMHLTGRLRYLACIGAVAVNLAVLLHYKYMSFLWGIAAYALGPAGIDLGPPPSLELPIGISFFTFQALSYIADVYSGTVKPARRFVDFAMYHSLFPQLIAGPIVRYVEIAGAVLHRKHTLDRTAEGICRFCAGLGKKLIIADAMGAVVDPIFQLPLGELTISLAWLGVLCYTLQIYFDFSGYSDMAIGLGKLFGFDFPENFNQPYRSRSITEFWRRWHMTLSRWFRDYVYVPLGGNRRGPWRTYLNLFVVFFLCGLWHGAGYTFIIWGIYHGALLVIERLYRNHFGTLSRGPFFWLLTLLLVMIGWVLFRSPTMSYAAVYLATLCGLVQHEEAYYGVWSFLTLDKMSVLLAGFFFALVPFERFSWRFEGRLDMIAAKGFFALAVFFYAVVVLSARSFNPFIYFRF
jgi:alginate O-acetyltransferase complex protein AlgI